MALGVAGLAMVSVIIHLVLQRHLLPEFDKLKPTGRWGWLVAAAIFGFFVLAVTGKPPISIWTLPKHELSASRVEGRDPRSTGNVIQVDWMSTGLSDISFSSLGLEGEWQREKDALINNGERPAVLSWQGRVGENALVLFTARPDGGIVILSWDGKDQVINLYSPEPKALPVKQDFAIPFYSQGLGVVAIGVTSAFLFLALTLFLLKNPTHAEPVTEQNRWAWLRFALPMILVWGIFLLTFWPGMMSRDSFDQWQQVVTGRFTDGHPAFHTMLIWLITRVWNSPSAVAIVQIMFLSLTAAWGIGILIGLGLPIKLAWVMAALFAISPVNAIFSITLWKDVAYSTALFLFSLQVLKIITSEGKWLENRSHWIWLGIVAALVSLFRHNGIPVMAASLVVLAVVFRRHWRILGLSLVILLISYFGIKGPLYDWIKVSPQTETKQIVFLHHIAAHIHSGTEILPAEQSILDQIQPVDQWKYDCCAVTKTYYDPGFSPKAVERNSAKIMGIWLALFKRAPQVDIKHWLCTGALVGKIQTSCPLTTGLFSPDLETLTWVIPNEMGINQHSLLPGLVPILSRIYMLRSGTPLFLLLWSPALYLFLGIYATAIFTVQRRKLKYLLFIIPAVLHSAVFFLVNISFQFRYQYSVYLVGLFSLGFLMMLIFKNHKKSS